MELPFDLDAEVVRLIRSKSIELPTYPGVALKLQKLLSGGDYGLDSLSKMVQTDQALATNVMRAANSAFYRASAPASNLGTAISRIGAKELCNIAIAGTLGVTANAEGPLAPLRKESWRASLVSALVCQELARVRSVEPGDAFLAGLLHDFGETIAYACFEAILESHADCPPQHLAQWQWEGQRYHVELGMALATEWKLPDYIDECVRRHADSDFSDSERKALIELVALSDAISLRLLEAPTLVDAKLHDVPGLKPAELARLENLVPRVPAFLQSFDDAAVAVPTVDAPPPSLVTQPQTTLPPDARTVDFGVNVTKKGQSAHYRATAWSPNGLRMVGAQPQPERHLLTLELPGGLKVCATVLLCAASDAGCLLEVKPFAMDRPTTAAWAQLAPRPAAAA